MLGLYNTTSNIKIINTNNYKKNNINFFKTIINQNKYNIIFID